MGVIPSSGAISISQISQELVNSSKSLRVLSADAGKSTPDSMSEFYGYALPTAYVRINQGPGVLDTCGGGNIQDSYGQFNAQGPDFGTINESYGIGTYNTEKGSNAGTFLTFGYGYSDATVHGRTSVTIYSWSNGYDTAQCYATYSYINLSGVGRVANANCTAGFVQVSYTFTADPGGSYTFDFGIAYGSV
jgi:hypothetical protein